MDCTGPVRPKWHWKFDLITESNFIVVMSQIREQLVYKFQLVENSKKLVKPGGLGQGQVAQAPEVAGPRPCQASEAS